MNRKVVGKDRNGKDICLGDAVIVGTCLCGGIEHPIIDKVKQQEWGVEPLMYFNEGVIELFEEE